MTEPLYGVYGASGLGRQVMPLARDVLQRAGFSLSRLVFVDDNPPEKELNGHQVLTYNDFMNVSASSRYVVLAVGDGIVRQKIANKCASDNVIFWSVLAGSAVVTDNVELGEGAVLSHFSLLTCNIRVGRFFQANHYAHVSHDCVIGDFVTFAPGVRCNGNVHIEDYAYIGSGAVIKQGAPGKPLVIGKGATVGMGAVVTKSVPPGVTVVGNPARKINKG